MPLLVVGAAAVSAHATSRLQPAFAQWCAPAIAILTLTGAHFTLAVLLPPALGRLQALQFVQPVIAPGRTDGITAGTKCLILVIPLAKKALEHKSGIIH